MTALNFAHTLDRRLVHRHANSEVFVTAVDRVDENHYGFAAQLPRWHPFFSDGCDDPHACHDLLLLVEVARQGSFALAHTYEAVPLPQQFLIRWVNAQILEPDALRIGDTPLDVVCHCRLVRRFHREQQLVGAICENEVRVGDRTVARIDFSASWMPPELFERLRREWRASCGLGYPPSARVEPTRLHPYTVGRTNPLNVLIEAVVPGDGAIEATVVADSRNPTLFDHPVDHVPGMAQLEAARQLSTIACPARGRHLQLRSLRAEFAFIAEPDVTLSCHTELTDDGSTRSRLRQHDRTVAEINLGWSAASAPSPNRAVEQWEVART
ncbi:AfsA-related hotdog domain-containing protein [Nocardia iowensis]|uniref:A-factor biosynthesis hotdog domain-containing protein n=1 Tax=Nocardia iowensis TaxID=204891 RepID=A0ABX8RXW5_NOCIO|nr:AfsA-related hotdog domain-containing protein [Nocardia iowensis]QXN94509.1 hypothetical protein KV110_16520 [Nocardia iowensis]